MQIEILYEDPNCIVVAKPPQLLTHGHPRFPKEKSLITRVQEQCGYPLYIVHRLDRGASGCLLIAKHPHVVAGYKEQLRQGVKTYLAVSRGLYRGNTDLWVENPMKVNGVYKEARSYVRFLGGIGDPRCSFFLVQPQTGRFHQVRRHVRDLSHPILGDSEHGDSKINRWWRENMGLQRLALHAVSIDIKEITVQCPLFPDQQVLFSKLSCWSEVKIQLKRYANFESH